MEWNRLEQSKKSLNLSDLGTGLYTETRIKASNDISSYLSSHFMYKSSPKSESIYTVLYNCKYRGWHTS